MRTQSRTLSKSPPQQGFTIVELMVALVISMLVSTAIYAIFIQSEAQQRRTSDNGDMWQQARIAMTMIQRDVAMAGYGLGNNTGCTVGAYYSNGTTSRNYSYALMPILSLDPAPSSPITGPSGSDQITVIYSNSNSGGLLPARLTRGMPLSSAELNVTSTLGFSPGDLVILDEPTSSPRKNCTQVQITTVQDSALKLQHDPGQSGPTYNPPGGLNSPPFPNGGYSASAGVNLYNMGSMTNHQYSISTTSTVANKKDSAPNLILTDVNTGSATPIARGIVSLQVLYGLDTNGDNQVDTYARPNGGSWFANNGDKIRTVRISLLARSTMPDKNYTSPASITLLPAIGNNAALVYNVPNSDTHYRYQLFVTEVPIRNLIWGN